MDEGDIVKTDGKFIYTLTGETLRITSADSGKLKVLSRLNFDSESYGYPSEMYIAPDRVAIISTSYGFVYAAGDEEAAGDDSRQRTFITVYDTTDKENPSLIGTLAQNGTFVSSRMVDGYIYIVSNYDIYAQIERNKPETYVPCLYEKGAERTVAADKIALYDTVQNSSYTVVTSVSIENPDAHAGEAAVLGGNSNIYCDGKSLVTADTSYIYEEGEIKPDASGKNRKVDVSTQKTVLTRFELNNGAIEKKASSTIPGALLNQFSMDIYNNVLRIVATNFMSKTTTYTDGVDTYEYEDKQSNSVYTLDENLNMLGKIENIAENESVQSVRFDGNVGYFVTFRQVDPLFAVDLSNPSNPRIMSALKIPGFSQYLHKFDEGLLFGIGYDADEETGWTNKMKMTMFDISDPFDVTEKHTLKLDIDSSEASYNHKAILIDRERNLIAFPAQKWDEKEGKASYLIYGYDENTGFFEKKEVNLDDEWLYNSRGLFIGDFFYVTSDNGIVSFDMTEFGKIDSVKWQSMSPEK
ncbi:MAG: beta-propeller domain-containing protein [Clostridia bacterium]|nr:beta-propeller domain-containing protein [Clostridia bacterium]